MKLLHRGKSRSALPTTPSAGGPAEPSCAVRLPCPCRTRRPQAIIDLLLEVVRTSDGLEIPSRPYTWLPVTQPGFNIGAVTVGD